MHRRQTHRRPRQREHIATCRSPQCRPQHHTSKYCPSIGVSPSLRNMPSSLQQGIVSRCRFPRNTELREIGETHSRCTDRAPHNHQRGLQTPKSILQHMILWRRATFLWLDLVSYQAGVHVTGHGGHVRWRHPVALISTCMTLLRRTSLVWTWTALSHRRWRMAEKLAGGRWRAGLSLPLGKFGSNSANTIWELSAS